MSFSITLDNEQRTFSALEDLLEECFPGEDLSLLAHYAKGEPEWYHIKWDLCTLSHTIVRIEYPHYIDNIKLDAYHLKPRDTEQYAWTLTKSP